MRPVTLPEAQFENFSKVLETEMGKEQEDEGIGPEEAFLRVALKTYGFDPDDGYQTDGAYDCGFDFVYVTQEETSIFQSKTLSYESGLPSSEYLDASYLSDLRRIVEVLNDLDHIPREANRTLIEALTSMRSELARRALLPASLSDYEDGTDVLDEEHEYRVNIYFLGLAKGFSAQAEEEFARFSVTAPIKYGDVRLTVAMHPIFISDILSTKWQQRNVDWKDKAGKKREDITIHVSGEAIMEAKSAIFFAPAYDLVQAYEDFGYQIFEPNVRCELKESKVNQAIKKPSLQGRGDASSATSITVLR